MDKQIPQSADAIIINEDIGRYIIENANMAIIVTQELILKFVNSATELLTGYARNDLINHPFTQLVHPDDLALIIDRYKQRVQGKDVPASYEFRIITQQGICRWVEIKAERIKWQNDYATLCFLSDITASKNAQQELKATLQQMHDIMEFQPDPTYVINNDRKVIAWNKAMEEMTGVKREAIIGQGDYAYSLPLYNERRPILIDLIFSSSEEATSKYSYVKAHGDKLYGENFISHLNNGKGIHAWGIASPLFDQTGKQIGAIETIRDVTERKETEERLRQSESRFRLIADNVNEGFWVVDFMSRQCLYSNPALDNIYAMQLTNVSADEMFAKIHPDELDMVKKERSSGKSKELEYRIVRPDGDVRWLRSRGFAVTDENGKTVRLIGVTTDITIFKKAAQEAENHRLQMIQSDKMATLGVLVSGVAHEINNPNNYLMLNSKIIERAWKDVLPLMDEHYKNHPEFTIADLNYGEARELLPDIIQGLSDGTKRIKRIVESLRNYARKDTAVLNQEIMINNIVESSLVLLSNMIHKATNNFETHLAEGLPCIKGNSQQLEQVIINIVSNACQSLGNRSRRIDLYTQREDSWVVLKVVDQGCGISVENASKIFDPFFTTKQDIGGTGLGLSISKNIIQNHNGTIEFESLAGKGSTVTLRLPAIETRGKGKE